MLLSMSMILRPRMLFHFLLSIKHSIRCPLPKCIRQRSLHGKLTVNQVEYSLREVCNKWASLKKKNLSKNEGLGQNRTLVYFTEEQILERKRKTKIDGPKKTSINTVARDLSLSFLKKLINYFNSSIINILGLSLSRIILWLKLPAPVNRVLVSTPLWSKSTCQGKDEHFLFNVCFLPYIISSYDINCILFVYHCEPWRCV